MQAYGELHFEDFLVRNLFYSIKLNVLGYIEAVGISIPLGFLLGLFPGPKSFSSKMVNAVRYIPLTAVTGLFIAWFGIEDFMKIQFLAFGILVYLLPVVVQRNLEVDEVYIQTAYTLGASQWQMIKTVFWPSVISKISDDIRVLIAISWTYIIVAELVNRTGGIGALIFMSAKQSRVDKVFALLIVIIAVGYLQDKAFEYFDKKFFPYKYQGNGRS